VVLVVRVAVVVVVWATGNPTEASGLGLAA